MNRMKHFNVNDGLIYNDDGSREFVDGGIVEGANGEWIGRKA